MKYAIIADIHANLPALDAVLQDIKEQGCDQIVCLGDLVGYYDHPKECLDIIRGMNIPCVKGNHDEYCSADIQLHGFNPHGAEIVYWTRNELTEDDRQWLQQLGYVRAVGGFTIVHATLDGPQRWGYVFDKLAAAASFQYQKTPVCFYGHTHVPVAFIRNKDVRGGTYVKFKVEQDKGYFVNVGSVGQPRDSNPKPAYATYDLATEVIELRRVDCDMPPRRPGGDNTGTVLKQGLPKKPITPASNIIFLDDMTDGLKE
jgi:predicted phosphodiesterase